MMRDYGHAVAWFDLPNVQHIVPFPYIRGEDGVCHQNPDYVEAQFTTMNNDHTTCNDPRCMDPDCVAKRETVNHPAHYNAHPSGVEAIDIVRHMDFCLGNAFKYLFRCGSKGSPLEDLKKARWYIEDALKHRRKGWAQKLNNALHGGYDLGLDAPHSVWRVVRTECRFSGHMAAALGSVWSAWDRPRTTVFLERALDSVKRMESIIVLTGRMQ